MNSLPLGHLVSLGVLVTVVYVVYAARSKVWITRYPMKVGLIHWLLIWHGNLWLYWDDGLKDVFL